MNPVQAILIGMAVLLWSSFLWYVPVRKVATLLGWYRNRDGSAKQPTIIDWLQVTGTLGFTGTIVFSFARWMFGT